MLYVVATPIGNLEDITLRAIRMLKECDFVIAENPVYSRRLLDHIKHLQPLPPASDFVRLRRTSSDLWQEENAVDKQVVQFAEFNEQQTVKELARRLKKENACLITDAGTPGISDPGFRLVRECVKEGVQVVPIPGASASITALSASGLPTDKFVFMGFLQKTSTKTLEALQGAADIEATAIFYESPERITKTLSYIANAFPTSQVVAARELTKMHEEFLRGTPGDVLNQLKEKPSIKGEFTVMVSFK
jgi:16S rRNA (cytidine1402-2'-O)-methyltransferase